MRIEGRVCQPPAGVEHLQGQHSVDHIGPRADGLAIARTAVPRRAKGVAFREQRRRERRLPQHAVRSAGQQQPREPRMGRQARERAAERRDPIAARVVAGDGPQPSQERGRPFDRLLRGLVEPGKVVALADRQQLEQRPGEVLPQGLGWLRGRAVVMGGLVPEPPADAGLGAARTAGPLVGRRLRDRHEFEPRQARARRDPRLPGQPRIDHGGDAGNRQRRLGHVRGQDHLAAADVVEHPILSLGRQVAIERQHGMPLPLAELPDGLLTATDLAHAGQEHEHVPRALLEGRGHRLGHEHLEVAAVAVAEIADGDRKHPPLGMDHGARCCPAPLPRAEQSGHGLGREGGAHHDHAEIRPHRLPQPHEQAEHEIQLQAALVKLVEHDRGDARQDDVADQPAKHDPGRRDDEPRLAAHLRVEPHLVAHLAADGGAPQACDPVGDGPRCQPPRLEQHDASQRPEIVEHGRGHERGLAGAGRRGDDHRPAPRRGHHLPEHACDGKIGRHDPVAPERISCGTRT